MGGNVGRFCTYGGNVGEDELLLFVGGFVELVPCVFYPDYISYCSCLAWWCILLKSLFVVPGK